MTRLIEPLEATAAEPAPTLETLYRRYAGWLVAKLRRRFNANLAEDLAQETYLRIANLDAAEIQHPRALLMRVAVNAGLDHQRRQFTRRAVAGSYAGRDAAEVDIPQPPDQLEPLVLKDVILGLPSLYRDVFLLSRFEGLAYEEIAEHLGVSVITVKRRMAKALKLCAAQLRD